MEEKTTLRDYLVKRYTNDSNRYLTRLLYPRQKTPIQDSFINLSLVKETEQKKKEQAVTSQNKAENQETLREQWLSSYETIYGTKTPIALDKLWERQENKPSEPKKLLLLGRAGIGKSTLCQYVSHAWATGKLWSNYALLIWIPLRRLQDYPEKGKDDLIAVIDWLIHREWQLDEFSDLNKEAIKNQLRQHQAKTLYLLDGLDEAVHLLNQEQTKSGARVLKRLLEQTTSHIFITSRPGIEGALGSLSIDKRLEVIGFTDDNIPAFVNSFFKGMKKAEQANDCLAFLNSQPSIWGTAHVPINAELMCSVWYEAAQQGQELSKRLTLSVLYTQMVGLLQKQYQKKRGKKALDKETLFKALSKVAFAAFQQRTLLINAQQVETQVGDKSTAEALLQHSGFLKQMAGITQNPEYHFPHLTFQEYFTAYYLAQGFQQPVNSERFKEAITTLKACKYHRAWEIVWWFTAGILYNEGKPNPAENLPLIRFWDALQDKPRDLIGVYHFRLAIRCLDECQTDSRLPYQATVTAWVNEWFDEIADGEQQKELGLYLSHWILYWVFHQKGQAIDAWLISSTEWRNLFSLCRLLPSLFTTEQRVKLAARFVSAIQNHDTYYLIERIYAYRACDRFHELASFLTAEQLWAIASDFVLELIAEVNIIDRNYSLRKTAKEGLIFLVPLLKAEQRSLLLPKLVAGIKEGCKVAEKAAFGVLGKLAPLLKSEEHLVLFENMQIDIVNPHEKIRKAAYQIIGMLEPFLILKQRLVLLPKLVTGTMDSSKRVSTEVYKVIWQLASLLTVEQSGMFLSKLAADMVDGNEKVRVEAYKAVWPLVPLLTAQQRTKLFPKLIAAMKVRRLWGNRGKVIIEAYKLVCELAPLLSAKQRMVVIPRLVAGIAFSCDLGIIFPACRSLVKLEPLTDKERSLLLTKCKKYINKNGFKFTQRAWFYCHIHRLTPFLTSEQLAVLISKLMLDMTLNEDDEPRKSTYEYHKYDVILVRERAYRAAGKLAPLLTNEQRLIAMHKFVAGICDKGVDEDVRKAAHEGLVLLASYLSAEQHAALVTELFERWANLPQKSKQSEFIFNTTLEELFKKAWLEHERNEVHPSLQLFPASFYNIHGAIDIIVAHKLDKNNTLMLTPNTSSPMLLIVNAQGERRIALPPDNETRQRFLTELYEHLEKQAKEKGWPTDCYKAYQNDTPIPRPNGLEQPLALTSLHKAVISGNLVAVEKYLKENPSLLNNQHNAERQSPLHLAVMHGHIAIVKYLLTQGAQVHSYNQQQETPLGYVCDVAPKLTGRISVYEKLLLRLKKKLLHTPQPENTTSLMRLSTAQQKTFQQAIDTDNSTVLQTLLASGVPANAVCDEAGTTLLMQAAQERCTKLVEELLSQGANLRLTNNAGQTTIQLTEEALASAHRLQDKSSEFVKLLIQHSFQNTDLVSQPLATLIYRYGTQQDDKLISETVERWLGLTDVEHLRHNPDLRTMYRLARGNIINLNHEQHQSLRQQGLDFTNFLMLRLWFLVYTVVRIEAGLSSALPKGVTTQQAITALRQEIQLNVRMGQREVARKVVQNYDAACIGHLAQAEASYIQAFPAQHMRQVQTGYYASDGTKAHCIYVNFYKTDANTLLIRIDNRWLGGDKDSQLHPVEKDTTLAIDGRQYRGKGIRPYLLTVLNLNNKLHCQKLQAYCFQLMKALAIASYSPSASANQQKQEATALIYDDSLPQPTREERKNLTQEWPLQPLQGQSDNCTLSSHNFGLAIRLGEKLYHYFTNQELLIWQQADNSTDSGITQEQVMRGGSMSDSTANNIQAYGLFRQTTGTNNISVTTNLPSHEQLMQRFATCLQVSYREVYSGIAVETALVRKAGISTDQTGAMYRRQNDGNTYFILNFVNQIECQRFITYYQQHYSRLIQGQAAHQGGRQWKIVMDTRLLHDQVAPKLSAAQPLAKVSFV